MATIPIASPAVQSLSRSSRVPCRGRNRGVDWKSNSQNNNHPNVQPAMSRPSRSRLPRTAPAEMLTVRPGPSAPTTNRSTSSTRPSNSAENRNVRSAFTTPKSVRSHTPCVSHVGESLSTISHLHPTDIEKTGRNLDDYWTVFGEERGTGGVGRRRLGSRRFATPGRRRTAADRRRSRGRTRRATVRRRPVRRSGDGCREVPRPSGSARATACR